MGIVIGLNWPLEHDHSAAAIVDGKLVFVAEEERFTRHKHSISEPPFNALYNALYFLKKEFGIKPQDISDFAINFSPYLFSKRVRKDYIMNAIKRLSLISETSILRMSRENFFNYFFNADYSKLAYELIRAVYRKLDAPLPNNIKIHPVI
ncbi:MAG: carbamoyltransferase, partial [Sulfolobus sp.]|nr:carbamoyltransferase [Sulfolobus sp.]